VTDGDQGWLGLQGRDAGTQLESVVGSAHAVTGLCACMHR
jgi:hypothetical protein